MGENLQTAQVTKTEKPNQTLAKDPSAPLFEGSVHL